MSVQSGAVGAPQERVHFKKRWWGVFHKLFRRKLTVAGAVIVFFLVLVGLAAPYIVPYDPNKVDVIHRLSAPSAVHWLGTDHLGRDVLTRVVLGARLSLTIGFGVMAFAVVFGMIIGVLAGFFRHLDGILMRIMDGLMAFPGILLAIALMAVLGPNLGNVIIALGIMHTPRIARVIRSSVLVVREMMYVEAVTALGAPTWRILLRHVIPNALSPVTVQGTFTFAYAVLGEAALSFLGVGVPPYIPSWGTMLSDARLYMIQASWMTIAPGLAIVLVVFGVNLLGDSMRDLLDPRFRSL